MTYLFPFSGIIGQEDLKLALVLNGVNPGIGGVLIRGEKGTAKSTIVRALSEVLPRVESRPGCPFHCDPRDPDPCEFCRNTTADPVSGPTPVVTLPLNATEDRVAGGMDFDQAVRQGRKILQPGLLAKAHRGILYVDEVNLLDDHIVDIILDAAASGENRVEREGISFAHAARFLLVGTMNPEEGDLRPQLLDRFGFCIETAAEADPELRVDLMVRREEFDLDPEGFRNRFLAENQALAQKIKEAAARLPKVAIPSVLRGFIAELVLTHHAAGHRADIVMEQAALAHAAFQGREEVKVEDISAVAPFVLLHRKQEESDPPPPPPEPPEDPPQPPPENESEEEPEDSEKPEEESRDSSGEEPPPPPPEQDGQGEGETREETPLQGESTDPTKDTAMEQIFEIGVPFKVKSIELGKDKRPRRGSGRRSRSRTSGRQGRYVKATLHRGSGDIAFDATLRAAAPYQKSRALPPGMCVALEASDIREKVREKKMGNFLLFLVDASGSMGARGRMSASKGAILSLLLDAYQKRDRVAMISFRRDEAVVNLPVTNSIELAARYLAEMPVGGRTPLSAGLEKSKTLLDAVLFRDPEIRPILITITDGKSNVSMGQGKPLDEAMAMASHMAEDERVTHVVVDTEAPGLIRFGLAKKLAQNLNGLYFPMDDLKSESLVELVETLT